MTGRALDREALLAAYRAGATLDELGEAHGVTREWIRLTMRASPGDVLASRRARQAALAEFEAQYEDDIRELLMEGESLLGVSDLLGLSRRAVQEVYAKLAPGDLARRDHARRDHYGKSRRHDQGAITAALRQAAALAHPDPLTSPRYERLRRAHPEWPSLARILQVCGWNPAKALAGLPTIARRPNAAPRLYSDDDMLDALDRVAARGRPSLARYDRERRLDDPSPQTIRNRFGGWSAAKVALEERRAAGRPGPPRTRPLV